jgi:hypothetical protein
MSDFHRDWRGAVIAGSLVSAPVLLLVSGLALPSLSGSPVVSAREHSTGYAVFVLAGLIASISLVAACLALSLAVAERRPLLGGLAAVLTLVGNCLALVDWGSELVTSQMGDPALDQHAMEALRALMGTAPMVQIPTQLSGIVTLIGLSLLAIGIPRAKVGPVAAAAGLPVGALGNLLGFATGSLAVQAIGNLVLTAAMVALAWRWVRPMAGQDDVPCATANLRPSNAPT